MMNLVIRFLFVFFVSIFSLNAQTKIPLVFKIQEKKVAKHIHKFIKGDTLLETSNATIHLHYSSKPNKPYLLMIHGLGVNGRTNWYKQIKALSKHYNLLIPDLIYFGESTSKEENYSVEFQAEQLHEALVKMNVNANINVMGFSYGGLTASVYNQLYSEEVNKLIIIDAPVKFYSAAMSDSLAQVNNVKNIASMLVPENKTEFKAMMRAAVKRPFPTTNRFKRKFIAHVFTPDREVRIKQINYLMQHQATYKNYNYHFEDTKVLLLWGAKDGIVPLQVGKELNRYFASTTQLIVFKKAKHDATFSYSRKLNKEVINFLKN
jgi:pimeloyl-ACP methyl ester carboxylesterase